jgi:hypothetical protein
MKSFNKIILAAAGILTVMAGCKKYEQFPVDKVTINYVFDKKDSLGYQCPDVPLRNLCSTAKRS